MNYETQLFDLLVRVLNSAFPNGEEEWAEFQEARADALQQIKAIKADHQKSSRMESMLFLLKNDANMAFGSFINLIRNPVEEKGRKTQVWYVYVGDNGVGIELGCIKWFGRWRKYCFFPNKDTVYEEVCMREVAFFCEALTSKHRGGKKWQCIVRESGKKLGSTTDEKSTVL